MSDFADKLRGKFIVLDGPDGAGKTTQLELLAKRLEADGLEVCRVRDPGGTAVGDMIREILLTHDSGDIVPDCEMLLFMASRAQLVAKCIRPAIEAGQVVLCDRFVSATVAYQGASGVDVGRIIKMWELAGDSLWPDITVILDLSARKGRDRLDVPGKQGEGKNKRASQQLPLYGDRMETRRFEYQQKVREGFKKLRKCYPTPVAYVQADREIDAVAADVAAALDEAFG